MAAKVEQKICGYQEGNFRGKKGGILPAGHDGTNAG
jgi:hypothetical protein